VGRTHLVQGGDHGPHQIPGRQYLPGQVIAELAQQVAFEHLLLPGGQPVPGFFGGDGDAPSHDGHVVDTDIVVQFEPFHAVHFVEGGIEPTGEPVAQLLAAAQDGGIPHVAASRAETGLDVVGEDAQRRDPLTDGTVLRGVEAVHRLVGPAEVGCQPQAGQTERAAQRPAGGCRPLLLHGQRFGGGSPAQLGAYDIVVRLLVGASRLW
jgi:hypothetical protein